MALIVWVTYIAQNGFCMNISSCVSNFSLFSLLISLLKIVFYCIVENDPIVTAKAFINRSQIVGLDLEKQSIDMAFGLLEA